MKISVRMEYNDFPRRHFIIGPEIKDKLEDQRNDGSSS
jgi:hypothetical protein